MDRISICKCMAAGIMLAALFIVPFAAAARPPQSAPNITVNGQLAADKVGRGRTVQATITMDIPSGYHVNSNKPLEKFLVPTELKIEAPKGIRIGSVIYPRAVLRNFKFSKSKVSVYEGRATMRFNVIVPAGFTGNSAELKAHLRYQSCNDEACFPPQTHDISMWLTVAKIQEAASPTLVALR